MMDYEDTIERERLVTAKEVGRLTGLSRVTLWRKSKNIDDPFPDAFRFGTNFTRWKLSEILDWRDSLRKSPQAQS